MLSITDTLYYNAYLDQLGFNIEDIFNSIDFSNETIDLNYRVQSSAVFSSNIEGNTIDLNSYMNTKLAKEAFKPQKQLQEIEDLVEAYNFAQFNLLNEDNFLKIHQTLSKSFLIKSKRGNYRSERMVVLDMPIPPNIDSNASLIFSIDLDI